MTTDSTARREPSSGIARTRSVAFQERSSPKALVEAGYSRLEQLTHITEAELGQLHGMGPKALRQLREALAATGRAFEATAPGSRPE
jgi:hypothetical protein